MASDYLHRIASGYLHRGEAITNENSYRVIGMTGVLTIEALYVTVIIENVRTVYGRIDFYVRAVAPSRGVQWVSSQRVILSVNL